MLVKGKCAIFSIACRVLAHSNELPFWKSGFETVGDQDATKCTETCGGRNYGRVGKDAERPNDDPGSSAW